jgi:hypothetical protein
MDSTELNNLGWQSLPVKEGIVWPDYVEVSHINGLEQVKNLDSNGPDCKKSYIKNLKVLKASAL